MRFQYKCPASKLFDIECNRYFYKEHNLITHVLFEHDFLMPICSTGIDEKIFKDNVNLLRQFKEYKIILSSYKSKLKRKFLQDMFGNRRLKQIEKETNIPTMRNSKFEALFEQNLENYHNGIFTRLQYIDHSKYDEYFNKVRELLKKIETKGLIYR